MRNLIQDVRFGLRMLAVHPGFAAVAIFTLALGIASTTTVFTWIDSVLLHPFSGATRPGELAAFEMVTSNAPNGGTDLSWLDYRDYRDQLKLTSGLALHRQGAFTIGEGLHSQIAWGELVSGNYFDVLGIQALRGRVFLREEQDDARAAHPIAVISERLWRRTFHADPGLIGKTIRLNRREITIAGITPATFRGTVPGLVFDLWVPVTMGRELGLLDDDTFDARGDRKFLAVARLRPGVTIEQARSEALTLSAGFAKTYPRTNGRTRASVLPTWRQHNGVSDFLLGPLELLMAVAVLVLLIVCANVANLLLARSVARQREFGIRLALGAGRARLARQLLTETSLLAIGGSLIGFPLVLWLEGSLLALVPNVGLPLSGDYQLNPRIFAFIAVTCVGTALISGLVPVFTSLRPDVNESLKEGGRGNTSSSTAHRARAVLVMAEVALAAIALVGAGLFARSFQNLRNIHPGFDSSRVLLGRFFIETAGYSGDQIVQFTSRLKTRLESMPAIRAVSYSDFVPLSSTAGPYHTVAIEGYAPADGEAMTVNRALIDISYFDAMSIPILEGRDFDGRDIATSLPVMIVNESFARRYFHGDSPIGRRVRCLGKWVTVVGEAKDSRYFSPAEPARPYFYLPYRQYYSATPELFALIRTDGDPERAIPTLRRAVAEVDPNAAAFHPVALAEYTKVSLFGQKVAASLMSALGAMCLVLAALGLYSVMSYSVSQRTSEIGIRMAMGARPMDVIGMVVKQGMRWTVFGLIAGSVAALAVTRMVGSMLVRVDASDPLTFLGAALFLVLVSAAATWIPAIRATRIDPMIALRRE